MTVLHPLTEIEERVAAGGPITREELHRVVASPDLVEIGVLGETARRVRTGTGVTFGRVLLTETGADVPEDTVAGEVRLSAVPTTLEEAVAMVRRVAIAAPGRIRSGFSLGQVVTWGEGQQSGIERTARTLASAGLAMLADVPVDSAPDVATLTAWIAALRRGGLAVPRLTVERAADGAEPLAWVDRAATVARELGGIAVFAPLARLDPVETPSTGYDDVKLVAAARLWCAEIDRIQVDWPLYGPKLAQVALMFGAGDIDGVSAVEDPDLGPRRSPLADIERQIRAAGCEPIERDGLYVAH
jgi:hypothetical protein